jgi:hypothetical protein
MKYLKRINESLNSKTLTKEEVIELLKKNCQKFLSYVNKDDGNLIFRKDEDRGEFVLVNPKLSTSDRIAPYSVTNFHNLLVSNLDSWKGWPRRNKSLVFASERRALTHGVGFIKEGGKAVDYVVIPLDNTKVATGDRSDFWECFGKLPNRAAFRGESSRPSISYYMTSLMRDLKTIKNVFDPTPFQFTSSGTDSYGKTFSKEMTISYGRWIQKYEPEGVDTDWSKMKSLLESVEIDERMIQKYFKVRGRIMWNPNMNLLENLNQLLNPTYNDFKLGDVTLTMNLYSKLDPDDENYTKSSLESWCEDEVILIKVDMLDTILNELEN